MLVEIFTIKTYTAQRSASVFRVVSLSRNSITATNENGGKVNLDRCEVS